MTPGDRDFRNCPDENRRHEACRACRTGYGEGFTSGATEGYARAHGDIRSLREANGNGQRLRAWA